MKIYAIGGIGADKRVFDNLKLNTKLEFVPWNPIEKGTTLEEYVKELSLKINTTEPFSIIGVSFGGIVAVELSKLVKPEKVILISSIQERKELPILYRIIGSIGLIKIIPYPFFISPSFITSYLFGAKNKELLNDIINNTDKKFIKWAIEKLTTWENSIVKPYIFKISGDKDRLLPPSYSENETLVLNGHHFMIVDKSSEISELVNKII